jgi:chromosome segregation ATPase
MNTLEKLKSVLCDPEGVVCISGSDGDRAVIQEALTELQSSHDDLAREHARLKLTLVELQREADQWKRELEIYKSTENKRILELEAQLFRAMAVVTAAVKADNSTLEFDASGTFARLRPRKRPLHLAARLVETEQNARRYKIELETLREQCARMRAGLESLWPGLVLDLRYADEDDDKDALQSRVDTVFEALNCEEPKP